MEYFYNFFDFVKIFLTLCLNFLLRYVFFCISFMCFLNVLFDVSEDDIRVDSSKVKTCCINVYYERILNQHTIKFKTNCTVSWTWLKDIQNAPFICTQQLP